jgi:hypothetical protein
MRLPQSRVRRGRSIRGEPAPPAPVPPAPLPSTATATLIRDLRSRSSTLLGGEFLANGDAQQHGDQVGVLN